MRFLLRPFLLISTALSLCANSVLAQATINITVGDNSYQPASVTASPGDNIVFTYAGNRSHPTVSDNNAFTAFSMDANNRTHTVVLSSPGAYGYHCQFHGGAGGVGMAGTITVQPLGTRADAPAASNLAAYPNPVSATRDERVSVSFTQRAGTEGRLRLLNVIGRVVREVPIRRATETGEASVALSVEELPAGVYFASLVLGERVVETKRLVVQP